MSQCDINGSLALVGTQPNNIGIFDLWKAVFGKLCEINQQYDIMASCDINAAIDRAGCCVDASPFKMLQAIYGKLCDVEEAITGNASTCIRCSTSDPVDGVNIPPCNCSLWVTEKPGVPNLWKSSDGLTWQAIIWSP